MSTSHWQTEPMILRIANAIARYIGFGDDGFSQQSTAVRADVQSTQPPVTSPPLRLMPSPQSSAQHPGHKWQRHPQLRTYEAPITTEVRSGRHDAVRGLFAARAGALEAAFEHFSIAARCEDLDITAVPGFWNLTRGQMQVAVAAYEAVGRYRESAALDAQIATIFRPSLVGIQLDPVVPRNPQHKAAST